MKKSINKLFIMVLVFSLVLSVMVGTGNVFSSAPNDDLQKIIPPSTDNANRSQNSWDAFLTMKGINEAGLISDKIKVLSWSYGVKSPRDSASGQATGRRMHKPMVIRKEWDKSSPLLFQKLITDGVLPEVVLTFTDTSEKTSYTVKLTNAHIVQIDSVYESDGMEEITFIAERIDMNFVDSKRGTTSGSDRSANWSFGATNSSSSSR